MINDPVKLREMVSMLAISQVKALEKLVAVLNKEEPESLSSNSDLQTLLSIASDLTEVLTSMKGDLNEMVDHRSKETSE